nr:endo alpha-1,4 polygalactosaminidase [Atopomonas sediminilitoris]
MLSFLFAIAAQASPSVAFFYGPTPPYEELTQFDWVVLQPNHASQEGLAQLREQGSKPIGYISVGEIASVDPAAEKLSQVFLNVNATWNSHVVDLTHPLWREHVLSQAKNLAKQGFQGLFFDTLDSFNLLPVDEREAQLQGLASLLRDLKGQNPELVLIFNRGFEVLSALGYLPDAVAVESLYAGWDAGVSEYRPVNESDREWLRQQLEPLREKSVPVIALEYLPVTATSARTELAKKLKNEGYISWISTPHLDSLGRGEVEVVPRRIAVVYDEREGVLAYNQAHTLLGGLLEYLGYRVDYLEVSSDLNSAPLRGIYAGVVLWMTNGTPVNATQFQAWLVQRIKEKVPLAILGGMPIESAELLNSLGLKVYERAVQKPLNIKFIDNAAFGFEGPLKLHGRGLQLFTSTGTNQPLLTLSAADGEQFMQAGVGTWGGFALQPYVLEQGGEHKQRWTLNPFGFLSQALRLEHMPVADFTTENGRRIATVHLDGDGFLSRAEVPGSPYAGQYVLDQFIKGYPGLLQSVSIIEGEIGPKGQFPHLARELEPIAREIFLQKTVEVASHSFSHPFYWRPEVASKREKFQASYGYHMPIPGYKLDYSREILGSVDYINKQLTSSAKPVKVMFWTGDALPNEETLRLTYAAGLSNVNGAVTKLTKAYPSLTGLYPMIRPVNGVLQFYAPIMNENVYTNLWTGPYYGFRELIETFELTNNPRRLRPLSLYYHFYAGTELASIRVMHELYRYIEDQRPISLWMSDYLQRMEGFYRMSLSKTLDGAYRFKNLRGLRTVRVNPALGWPDMVRSKNVAGAYEDASGRYVHLSSDSATLFMRGAQSSEVSLLQANIPLTQWQRVSKNSIRIGFSGEFPLVFSIKSAAACTLEAAGQRYIGQRVGSSTAFSLPVTRVHDAKLNCH